MAEFEDGNRIFERAYKSYEDATHAAKTMVDDILENTNWKVVPIVEDLELVDS